MVKSNKDTNNVIQIEAKLIKNKKNKQEIPNISILLFNGFNLFIISSVTTNTNT